MNRRWNNAVLLWNGIRERIERTADDEKRSALQRWLQIEEDIYARLSRRRRHEFGTRLFLH